MGKPIDYTGETFGRLFVAGLDHRGVYGGKPCNFWLCHCECGRKEVIPQSKLISHKRRECAVCQRGPCVVCGKPIENDRPNSTTCSEECHQEHRRRSDNLSKAKAYARDPHASRQKQAEKMSSIKADPEKYAAWLEKEKLRSRSRRNSPEKNILNRQARERYQKNKSAILSKRRERWDSLSEDEKQARLDRQREMNSRWYQQNKDAVRRRNREKWDNMSDDERKSAIARFRAYARKAARKKMAAVHSDEDLYDRYIAQQRRYEARRATRRALEKLLSDSQKLLGINDNADSKD